MKKTTVCQTRTSDEGSSSLYTAVNFTKKHENKSGTQNNSDQFETRVYISLPHMFQVSLLLWDRPLHTHHGPHVEKWTWGQRSQKLPTTIFKLFCSLWNEWGVPNHRFEDQHHAVKNKKSGFFFFFFPFFYAGLQCILFWKNNHFLVLLFVIYNEKNNRKKIMKLFMMI